LIGVARRVAVLLVAGALLSGASGPRALPHPTAHKTRGGDPAQKSTFAAQIAALSEPAGYFDTDNLISNERSYLQILPDLERANVRGGVYIGVGPDQNFSYIAAIRPALALIVDIRRDNLLLHLLFKAIFSISRTRVEYLALLLGRPVPSSLDGWRGETIQKLVFYAMTPPDRAAVDGLRTRVDDVIRKMGVPLSRDDFATIDRYHRRFIEGGVHLQFQSFGRPPQRDYPRYAELLAETDSAGRQRNYLASEEAFQFVKSMQAQDTIIPVVGDLGGPSALVSIGRLLDVRREKLSALYASNVEDYLFRDGRFPRFVQNLGRIPHSDNSVVIRSIFWRGMSGARPGDNSTSKIQPVDELLNAFAKGRIQGYGDLLVSSSAR
jgi:hypothetical protein